ncbi:MAG TPA: peptidase M24 [Isosphaeraceae bacterium]|jgi:Xaa-Pro aminopeptidase|nr:peptidase M24 [Isosphaeraceae bacterium]
MSTEVHLGDLSLSIPDGLEPLDDSWDRVIQTAEDRPTVDTLPALADPTADHADDTLAQRRADVDEKHRRVIDFLDATGYDAVVLGRADAVAWFTSGGDLGQGLSSDPSSVLLYINRACRAVITDNVQSARVFEEELAGLGFQLKERAWYDHPEQIAAEIGHNKRIATDSCLHQWPNESLRLKLLRLSLTRLERQRLRELGRTLTLAVEATCRNFMPDETEADVAGHLAHRLIREGVVPVDLRVASDDRLSRYRQPTFKAAPIRQRAIIAATGRRHGLCASVTRIVSFGPAESDFRKAHSLAAMVDATYIYFSRPGETVAGVFRRAKRIYEKFNRPHEWTLDYQGFLTGYSPREILLLPDCPLILSAEMAVCWSPSVGPARSEDTMVIDSRGGFEIVTDAQRWPKLEVTVKGFTLPRPGILER